MRRVAILLGITSALICSMQSMGYEQPTHVSLSEQAARMSVLYKSESLVSHLGLRPIEDGSQTFPNSDGRLRRIIELIQDGSDFEDGLTPCDSRPRNHFYDPRAGSGLRRGLITGRPSPDWAIEDNGDINDQEYSYKNARQYFYDALTKSNQVERNKNFGFTFQSLGHIVHHLQDMAQPQHVRNDMHLNFGECWWRVIFGVFENPSLYEQWTRTRTNLPFTDPNYNQGKPVDFNAPRAFWTTTDGKGLAQFTNRNFVSAGTNYQLLNGQPVSNAIYPQPVPLPGQSIHIRNLLAEEGRTTDLDGYVDFIANTVIDPIAGDKLNPRSASVSIFDQDLTTYNTTVTYDTDPFDPNFNTEVTVNRLLTLNRFNFNAAHDFLIPRAVAYSAGLINYFFRGRIDLDLAPGASNYVIKNYGNEDMEGTFALYYDAVDGTRHLVPGTGAETAWDGVSIPAKSANGPGRSAVLTFATPTDPPPAQSGEYVLVFRGRLGQEADAVVGRVINEYVYVLDGNGYVTRVSIYGGASVTYQIPLPSSKYGPTGLSVYDAVLFYNVNDGSFRSQAPGVAMRYRLSDQSSIVIAQTRAGTIGNGTAVNSDRLYVTEVGEGNEAVQVLTFNHDGGPTGSFPANPNYGGASVDAAANETHMVTTEGGHMFIFTRDGSPTATIRDLSWFSSEAAMNSDFAYTVDGPNVGIYSPNGILRQYVDLGPVSGFDIVAIDATDDRFYVVTSDDLRVPAYRLHVYERLVERDAAGNVVVERFNYQRAIPFTLSARWWPLSISADRRQLSRQPPQ